jgi:hypothetical protein
MPRELSLEDYEAGFVLRHRLSKDRLSWSMKMGKYLVCY